MKRLVVIVALLISLPVLADDYNAEIETFFGRYEKGQVAEAIDGLYGSNERWMASRSDAVDKVKTQLRDLVVLLGAYYGRVKIGERTVENRIVQVSWLALYDRQPIRMEFQFYRPEDRWILFRYAFDTQIFDEIRQGERDRIASGE